MEGRSENCLRLFAKPQDVKRAYEGSGIGSINKCPAKANALQQKIKHWAEMALLINNEFVQQPEGFGFVVKESALVCGFVEGFDTDLGDDLTPPGELAVFGKMEMNFSGNTTAADVYWYIQQAVEYAADQWQAIN